MLERKAKPLLFVVFFIFLVVLFQKVSIPGGFFFVFLVLFFFIQFVGNDVEMNGMDLQDFELGLALRAAQNLAFFDFVFIDIDFGGTFRAADHGSILRKSLSGSGVTRSACATVRVL